MVSELPLNWARTKRKKNKCIMAFLYNSTTQGSKWNEEIVAE